MRTIRTLILCLFAVIAVSAVASASASASATCYKVAEAGTGTFENNECTVAGGTKEYIKISKLETELAPGEWCAKVTTKETGNYETNKCAAATKKAKSEFIKVKTFRRLWDVCEEGGGSGTKYKTHKCKSNESGSGKWEWVVKESATYKENVKDSGGEFTLVAGGKTITCKKLKSEGTITGGMPGTDEATKITFEECTTGQAGCNVKSAGGTLKTIVVTAIPTKLEERETSKGVTVLADNFEQNATTKRFVTLEFEPETGKSCSEYPETEVKGDVAAEIVTGTGELNFPSPELKGNTLQAFGDAAKLTGKDTQELTNEWAYTAI